MHSVFIYLHRMSTFLLRCFILVLPLLAGACGEPPRKLPRLAADAVVLAFGDSLTFGTGAAEQESYPAQLEQLIGRRVVRAGVPGEVTAQALARLPAALDAPEFYAGIAKEFRLPYEESAIGEVLRDSSLKSDTIHPNAKGYRVIAERLAAGLRKSGAL